DAQPIGVDSEILVDRFAHAENRVVAQHEVSLGRRRGHFLVPFSQMRWAWRPVPNMKQGPCQNWETAEFQADDDFLSEILRGTESQSRLSNWRIAPTRGAVWSGLFGRFGRLVFLFGGGCRSLGRFMGLGDFMGGAQPLGALGALGHHHPGGFGAQAAVADIGEIGLV